MTIIDSSDPQAVIDDQLHWQLANRAVLTTAVVRELERSDNPAWDKRPRAALQALNSYLRDELGLASGRPNEGLDGLEVPQRLQPLIEEIRRGAAVCEHMRIMWTADTRAEYAGDLRKLTAALAEWRTADILNFTPVADRMAPDLAWDRTISRDDKYLLYMVTHHSLDIRKVGVTVSDRLETWRRRGWQLIRTIEFDSETALRAAEHFAIQQLDRLKARSGPRMESLYPNLDRNGRTEMYDPAFAWHSLDALISDGLRTSLAAIEPVPPQWISEPRKAAANKAWKHPNRNGTAAAEKAVITRRANAGGAKTHPGAQG